MSSRTFRDKIKKQDDDELSKGNLPKDFTDAHPVTLTEAAALLQKRTADEKAVGAPGMKMDNAVVSGCTNYIVTQADRTEGETFRTIGDKKEAVTVGFGDYINQVELIQLLNLRPRDVDEAKTLVTSLERIVADDEISALKGIIAIVNREG